MKATDYRLGVFVGVVTCIGIYTIASPVEWLMFGGLTVSWTTEVAFLAILMGIVNLVLSWRVHIWAKSVSNLNEIYGEDT